MKFGAGRWTLTSALVGIALAACSSSGSGGSGGTSGAGASGGSTGGTGSSSTGGASGSAGSAPSAIVGAFEIRLVAPTTTDDNQPVAGSTSVLGRVYDGATPQTVQWIQTAADGDCQLFVPQVPFCDPGCGSGELCVADQKCARQPSALGAGSVTVSGIKTAAGGTSVTMPESAPAYTYLPAAADTLAYPAFAEGDAITLTASGGTVPAFTINGKGIKQLALTGSGPLALQSGQAATVTWTPPGQAGITRIAVSLDISHHGGSKGKITCDVADTGTLTLSAEMMTKLINLGVAGYPSISLSRQAVSKVNVGNGTVQLTVVSDQERPITVPGVVSCTEDADCAAGKTCQPDLTCTK